MSLQPLADHKGLYLDNDTDSFVSTRQFIKETVELNLIAGEAQYKLLPGEMCLIAALEISFSNSSSKNERVEFLLDDNFVFAEKLKNNQIDFKTKPLSVNYSSITSSGVLKIKTSNTSLEGKGTLKIVHRLGLGAVLPVGYKTE